jgi:hypothetical protein
VTLLDRQNYHFVQPPLHGHDEGEKFRASKYTQKSIVRGDRLFYLETEMQKAITQISRSDESRTPLLTSPEEDQ